MREHVKVNRDIEASAAQVLFNEGGLRVPTGNQTPMEANPQIRELRDRFHEETR